MEDIVLSVSTLPKPLYSRFRSSKVWVHEENGVVTLTPVSESNMVSTESLEQIRQKRLAFFGCMKGEIRMADDFDDPIEEMREYME